MNWSCKSFDDLSGAELYALLKLRAEVFVIEQNCVCLDPDGDDPACLHLWAAGEDGVPVACCRIVPPGVKYAGEASLGRIVTALSVRGTGLGRALVLRAFDHARALGYPTLRISAQMQARGFYDALGFLPLPVAPYLEDDIPHLAMRKTL